MERARQAWAVRFWRWRPGVDREADVDPAHAQEEVFRRFPSEAMARAMGPRLVAREPLATSPGLFDLMSGTPDKYSADGWEWTMKEEIRP